ncbi:MAG: phosphate/phosphite/phosphonate ABC transporter substrate-binding protein [Nitrospirae bacterium]|nr:MAG: phosphate/phosphite/phosphonate ABC transporter substrate-binding protein [Nitrospirota bacterium]
MNGKRVHGMAVFLTVVLIVLFSGGCNLHKHKGNERVYKIGYMICNSRQETLERFLPLTVYLSKRLGIKMEAVPVDTVDFTREVENLDFTHTNSLLYIILNRFYGVKVLTADRQGSLGYRSTGLIAVRADSEIRTIAELKGRTMVFGPMLSPMSYLIQYDLMLRAGVNPDDDLSFYTIPRGSYKHEKVIYSVMFGRYDAGAFALLDYERMVNSGRIDRKGFRIIAKGEPIPYCTFGYTQRVDESLADRFRKALLSIRPDTTVEIDGEVVKVLRRAHLDGFAPVSDSDYDPVREMARRTNMPPYQRY